uniref:Uncharacterized protein n=1 Tax=Trichobilharzia regenti TaxID=157069 RepID=A0AA85J1T2_TRIRE|nr:unnamed protein product [Trichobilharzia regenti]
MKNVNGFPVMLYIAPAAALIGVHVGDEFSILLCLHYVLCRVFSRVSTSSLLLVFTMGTVLASEIMALRILLPASWHAPVNILYILLVNSFLCHYLLWSLMEFSLVNIEHEILEIPTFSSLPTSSCMLITLLGFGHWKKHMSLLTSVIGLPTLWLFCRYKPQEHLESLWNSIIDICTGILLILFPALNYIYYFAGGEEPFLKFLAEILFLITTTNVLLSQLHIRSVFTPKNSFYKRIFNVIPVFSGIILLMFHTDFLDVLFNTPDYLATFFVHFLFFFILISVTYIRLHHQTIQKQYVLKCISLILLFLMIGLYWNKLSKTLSISQHPLWNRRLMNQLFWSSVICLISSISTLFAYEYGNQELFDLVLGVCFYVFHYSEWCLYMTISISESWLFVSSLISIAFVFLLFAIIKGSSVRNSTFYVFSRRSKIQLFNWHVFSTCCLVPALLKLVLLWINRFITDSSQQNVMDHRAYFEKGFVLGLYLVILGFVCIERIHLFAKELTTWLLKFPILTSYFRQNHIIIESVTLIAYFHCAITLVWPQVLILMHSQTEMSVTSYTCILIQLSASCLMTSLAQILPSLFRINWSNAEMSTHSRCLGKLGFLLLMWFVNSRQLDLTLSGVLVYVAAMPTVIFCATWMICFCIFVFSMKKFTLTISSVVSYLLENAIVTILLILSCSFCTLVMMNLIPPNLTSFLMLSVYISCVVCLILWDINSDLLVSQLLHYQSYNHRNPEIKNPITVIDTQDFNDESCAEKDSESFTNESSEDRSAVSEVFCHLLIRLCMLCCGLVSLLGSLAYATYSMELPSDNVCQLYSLFSLKVFGIAQVSVGYPQRWLCDKIRCRSSRLFNNESKVLQFILTCVVNSSIVLSVILRFQFCSSFKTDLEVFFLPWIVFTFHGRLFNRYRHILALICFTIFLVYLIFLNSPVVKGYSPPLPTFDRQFFGKSNSSVYYWSEFLLTIALIPLHILFLTDQLDLSTQSLVNVIFFNYFGQSHNQHLPSSICFKCIKLYMANCLSCIFAYILCTSYVLLPLCISYWFIASSFASAIFGFYSFIICIYLLLRVDVVTDDYYAYR